MPKAFSVASWNVEHFHGNPERLADIATFLKTQKPDLFAISEVAGSEVYTGMVSAFPGYSFHITEGYRDILPVSMVTVPFFPFAFRGRYRSVLFWNVYLSDEVKNGKLRQLLSGFADRNYILYTTVTAGSVSLSVGMSLQESKKSVRWI